MADITATEKDAIDISGLPITYTTNKLCAYDRAKQLGCDTIQESSNNIIVLKKDLVPCPSVSYDNYFSGTSGGAIFLSVTKEDRILGKVGTGETVNSITEELNSIEEYQYYTYKYNFGLFGEQVNIYFWNLYSKITKCNFGAQLLHPTITFNNVSRLHIGGVVDNITLPSTLTEFVPIYYYINNKDVIKNILQGSNWYHCLLTFRNNFSMSTSGSIFQYVVNKFVIKGGSDQLIYYTYSWDGQNIISIEEETIVPVVQQINSGALIRHGNTLHLPFTLQSLEDFAIRAINGPIYCHMINPPIVDSYKIFRSREYTDYTLENLKLHIPKGTKSRYQSWINALELTNNQVIESITNIPLYLAVIGRDASIPDVQNALQATSVINVNTFGKEVDIFEYLEWVKIDGTFYHRYRNMEPEFDSYDLLIDTTRDISNATISIPTLADAKILPDNTVYENPGDKIQIVKAYYG